MSKYFLLWSGESQISRYDKYLHFSGRRAQRVFGTDFAFLDSGKERIIDGIKSVMLVKYFHASPHWNIEETRKLFT